MTTEQLLEQRDELVAALRGMLNATSELALTDEAAVQAARDALAKVQS